MSITRKEKSLIPASHRDKTFPQSVSMRLLLHFTHQSHCILETNLVGSSHLSGSGITHTVEDFVEYINLLLT